MIALIRRLPYVVLMILFTLFSAVPARVLAQAACVDQTGTSTSLDCDALKGNWPDWIPDSGTADCQSTMTLSGKDNVEKTWNFFIAAGLTPEQTAAVIGNLQQESSTALVPTIVEGNPSHPELPHTTNDPASLPVVDGWYNGQTRQPGWGIVQWTPSSKAVTKQQEYGISGPIYELATQLQMVLYEMKHTAPTGYQNVLGNMPKNDVAAATEFFRANYESGTDGNRQALAQAAFTQYGSQSTPSTGTAAAALSNPCGGIISSSLLKNALALAWPTGGHGKNKTDATGAYQQAMPQYNGATFDDPWSDCGVFVSTAIIASGIDSNYVKRGTIAQLAYLQAHPEKYQEIPNVTNTSQLTPGVVYIMVNDTHTYLYVGNQTGPAGNTYNSVGASLHDHVPEATNFYPGFSVFSIKQ